MTDTTLQRLIRYPHAAVFDKDAASELVGRLRHPGGATWSVASSVMTASNGTDEFTYDLSIYTVAGLMSRLVADGFEVIRANAAFDGYSALALVEGSGDQNVSNGDHLRVFTSLLWVLFSGYSREIDAAGFQVRQALLQMVIGTAEGEWLDLWGTLYSVQRIPGETDVAYRIRIPREAFRIRVNPLAIELAIKDATGKDVRILESWKDTFVLDQSILDGPDKMQDGERIGPFFIQAFSAITIDWSDVLPVIERNRPAGVLMLPPQVKYSVGLAVPNEYAVGTAVNRRHAASLRLEDMALLDYADIEETSVLNHPIWHRRTILHRTGVAVGATWTSNPWAEIPWADVSPYSAGIKIWRSYRVYKLSAEYKSQYWLGSPWQDKPWQDINALIGTTHSRITITGDVVFGSDLLHWSGESLTF